MYKIKDLMRSSRPSLNIIIGASILLVLYLLSQYDFLLFHVIAEFFSILVGLSVFMLVWNARKFIDNNYFLLLGVSFLFVGILSLLHTLAYKGMNIFHGDQANIATQLWIASRYLESSALVFAPFCIGKKLRVKLIFSSLAILVSLLILSIFYWQIFPVCYTPRIGLTPFKKISEYVISFIFGIAIFVLYRKRNAFSPDILRLLAGFLILSIFSEIGLTLYKDVYGFFNIIAHFLKIIATYLVYRAIIRTGFSKPYSLLFKNLKDAEKQLRKERDRAQKYLDVAGVMIVVIGRDQRVELINTKGCSLLGYREEELIGKDWFDTCVAGSDREKTKETFRNLMQGEVEAVEYHENRIVTQSGEEKMIAWHNALLKDEDGKVISALSAGEDITVQVATKENLEKISVRLELEVAKRTAELKEANQRLNEQMREREEIQKRTEGSNAILQLLSTASSRKEYLEAMVFLLKEWSACRCVGIRVLNEQGEIPYESYTGFSDEFWQKENSLSIYRDHCACIRVINDKPEPQDLRAMTTRGSYFLGNSARFLAELSENEKGRFRGTCIQEGFSTIVIIPIRYKDVIIAAIHLADEHQDQLPPRDLEFIESLSPLIGEGVHKFNMEDKIRQTYITQSVINAILRLSLQNISVQELLGYALDKVFTLSWLEFEPKGNVFLVEETPGILVLKTQKGFQRQFLEKCARVPFNKCICGQAASTTQIKFFMPLDKDHELCCQEYAPYGHYCVPIVFNEVVLGVINIYLKAGHRRDQSKEDFLVAFANALAGVIVRKQMEHQLSSTNKALQEEIAQHKKSEGLLLENAKILDSFFAQTMNPLVFMDKNFNFLRVNEAYATSCRKDISEFPGRNYFELYPHAENLAIFKRVIEAKSPYQAIAKPFSFPDHPEWGIAYWDWALVPILDKSQEVEFLVFSLRDVTEKKRAEANLIEAQKELERAKRLSDIGALAATVAHELRNPLGVIRTAAYNIKRKAKNQLLESHLGNIEKKISESDQIINNLLFYSRLRLPHYESANIHNLINEALTAAKHKFMKWKVKVVKKLHTVKMLHIDCDPVQMNELFINIFNNAYEAFPDKAGTIEVTAEKQGEDMVRITVSDTGIGIEAQDMQSIFEPFFTRKAKGTGLGLSVCYQIVSLHSGKIELKNLKGKGTSVSIVLPLKKAASKGDA